MEVEYRIWDEFPHHRIGSDGSVWSRRRRSGMTTYSWKLLTGIIIKGGYTQYCILNKDDRPKSIRGHQLVLSAFLGPCPPGKIGCHKNGDASDNRLDNLYWGTPQTNQDDRVRHGRSGRGHLNHRAKFTSEQVDDIRQAQVCGESFRSLARRYGVDKCTISRMCRGITWKPQVEVCNVL